MGSLPEKSTDGNNAETLGAVFSSHSAKNGLAFWLVGARAVDTAAQRAANDRVRLAIKKQLIEWRVLVHFGSAISDLRGGTPAEWRFLMHF